VEIGTIVAVRNFGAGDILEIAPAGQGESLLMPFTKAVVPTVDVQGERVVVEPPAEIEADREEKEA
jgi:16S rRNA processing protein RimM